MDAVTYSFARANLASTMDRVCDDHEALIITRNACAGVQLPDGGKKTLGIGGIAQQVGGFRLFSMGWAGASRPLWIAVCAWTAASGVIGVFAVNDSLSAHCGHCSNQFSRYKVAIRVTPPHLAKRPAHYLWAVLIARIYEVFPMLCPLCGGQMRITSLHHP